MEDTYTVTITLSGIADSEYDEIINDLETHIKMEYGVDVEIGVAEQE